MIRKMDKNGAIHFGHGFHDYEMDTAKEVSQRLKIRFLFFKGSWFLDSDFCINPSVIFGASDLYAVTQEMKRVIQETPYVLELLSFSCSFDPRTRKFMVQCDIRVQNQDKTEKIEETFEI